MTFLCVPAVVRRRRQEQAAYPGNRQPPGAPGHADTNPPESLNPLNPRPDPRVPAQNRACRLLAQARRRLPGRRPGAAGAGTEECMAQSDTVRIQVAEDAIEGTFLTPRSKVPGVLFIHGWGGHQDFDLNRARGIAALGCICLTFDLRGHAATETRRSQVSREDNLRDVMAAYDTLAAHPALDSGEIAVVGSSYGAYLAAILTGLRKVRWLGLHVPALYRDDEWFMPKDQLNRDVLRTYRSSHVAPEGNRALTACASFPGDVLIVESERDDFIPHSTIMSYRSAFRRAHSLTHRIVDGADHALTDKKAQRAYTALLVNWVTEMVTGARLAGAPVPGGERP